MTVVCDQDFNKNKGVYWGQLCRCGKLHESAAHRAATLGVDSGCFTILLLCVEKKSETVLDSCRPLLEDENSNTQDWKTGDSIVC